MENNYWIGKKVFITGINGFIGGNLCKILVEKGANVFGLIRNHNKGTFLFNEGLSDSVVLINGELIDKDLICRIISEEQINVVYHLAAQVEVGVGMANPYLTFETNIRGTYTLLEAIRQYPTKIEATIIASSDKAYGSYPVKKMPYKEDYPLIPKFPYDTSKACADMIAQVFTNDFYNLPIIITRFSNIYGPGQLNFSALIPDSIRSALGHSKFIPRSNGSNIRDFIFVEDVIDLYIRIAEALSNDADRLSGEIFNAGTNNPISVRDLLEMVYTLVGNGNDLRELINSMQNKDPKGEIQCQYMNYDKVNKYFDWSPITNLNEGLTKTLKWYESYFTKSFNLFK